MSELKNYLKVCITSASNIYDNCDKFSIDTSIDVVTGSFDSKDELLFTSEDILESYSPQKGDTFYFLPGVSIPRVKLKDLNVQYGIKAVRDIEKASHIFMGRKTALNLFDYRVFRMRQDRLFKTKYSKKESLKLHKKAKKSVETLRQILQN